MKVSWDEQPDVHRRLGLPEDFRHFEGFTSAPTSPKCDAPKTLEEAVGQADAVIIGSRYEECWNETTLRLEQLVAPELSWKGPEPGQWLVVSTPPGLWKEYKSTWYDQLHGKWYEARFLREVSPGHYEKDGCLLPKVEEGDALNAELEALLPIPDSMPDRVEPAGERPTLSCSKIDDKDFEDAWSTLRSYSSPEARQQTEVPPDKAGCASCSTTSSRTPPWWAILFGVLVGVAGLTRRRWTQVAR